MSGWARAIDRCERPILPSPTMPVLIMARASSRCARLVGAGASPCGSAIETEAVEQDEPEELRVAQVAAPVAPRLGRDSVDPLEAVAGHPARRTIDRVGFVIDRRTDPHEDFYRGHRAAVAVYPDLLLGRAQADDQHV